MPTYSLAQLAKLADVTPRTIRFYISQGLLPSPGQQGPSTQYSDEHLARLRLIKKLQGAHLPLAAIRAHMRSGPVEQLEALADAIPTPSGSAIDYIRDVLEPQRAHARGAYSSRAPAGETLPASAPAPAPAVAKSEPDRSQWERISLDPDIELHVRRPLTRHHNKRVERLIAIARQLFEEE
jgi:DNA-binding transcriptional MerR regulator